MIRIEDMETSHIQNAIRVIGRSQKGWRRDRLPALVAELRKRRQQWPRPAVEEPRVSAPVRQLILD